MPDPATRKPRAVLRWAVLVVAVLGAACGGPDPSSGDGGTAGDDGDQRGSSVVSVERGRELYGANCASCHGARGQGTEQGPPHVHRIYEPSHHGDAAFLIAVRQGVRPHHWDFGSMPPIEGLSDEDVADIVAYVRQLQREAGIE